MSDFIDIRSLPLYYISFKQSGNVEKHYANHGFTNVNHFNAVNGKELSLTKLLNEELITPRVYEEIKTGRHSHKSIGSLGPIGCYLAHIECLNECANKGYEYVIVTEEDNRMEGKLTNEQLQRISDAIQKPKGMFISSKGVEVNSLVDRQNIDFAGANFYVLSRDAILSLLKHAFPIDLHYDYFLIYSAKLKYITMTGFEVAKQDKSGQVSMHDICIKCYLPTSPIFYIVLVAFLLALITVGVKHLVFEKEGCKK